MAATHYQAALTIHQEIGAITLAIFDQVGLARIRLAQNQFQQADHFITPVVEWILAGNAQKFWDPWNIYLSSYQVLMALAKEAGDRADTARAILDEAHTLLHQRAGQISDPQLRRHFMTQVSTNRQIDRLWHQLHNPDPVKTT